MDRETAQFLDKYIFPELHDLNTGFDVPAIRYFSKDDFEIILHRCAEFGVQVLGIEPWPDGKFGGVKTYEDYTDDPADSVWYRSAFEEFLAEGIISHFAASYAVPKDVLRRHTH